MSPQIPFRSLGGAGALAGLASPPVWVPGGGRNCRVSGRADCAGLDFVFTSIESGSAPEVESDRAPDIRPGGATEVESRGAVEVESRGAATVESGGAADLEPGGTVETESGRAVVESAFTLVDAKAIAKTVAAHATTLAKQRKIWRSWRSFTWLGF